MKAGKRIDAVMGCVLTLASWLGTGLGVVGAEAGEYRISAAKGPYFVCDQRVVEDRWRLERFMEAPKRHPKNPLLVREEEWEGTGPHLGGAVGGDRGSSSWPLLCPSDQSGSSVIPQGDGFTERLNPGGV